MKEVETILTQERLKEIVTYNPETGIFTSNRKTTHKNIGDVMGGIPREDKYLAMTIYGNIKKTFLLHRLAFLYMIGKFPENYVDHINGNKSDNRWCNLREATSAENQRNIKCHKESSTGIKGLCYVAKGRPKYIANIRIGGKRLTKTLHLKGRVESEVVAQLIEWLKEIRETHHKEFARHK